ncbi:phosphonate C-P lyase system protein PhnH [Rhodobacteraceae bacterium 63075]|nr:phosphonate C-P lyase system protein PhnH [Rhodobacteraceae bacterium 63075]
MQAEALEGGFSDPARQAAASFRGVMEAMARPGTLHALEGAQPPAPVSPAAGAVILTLCDADTPLHLAGAADCSAMRDWVSFHTGAPLVAAADCAFALGPWEALLPLDRFAHGTSRYPDRSATLIVEHPALAALGARLRGPGIRTEAQLSLPDPDAFRANNALFPRGLDFFFTDGSHVAALPRSTEVC